MIKCSNCKKEIKGGSFRLLCGDICIPCYENDKEKIIKADNVVFDKMVETRKRVEIKFFFK